MNTKSPQIAVAALGLLLALALTGFKTVHVDAHAVAVGGYDVVHFLREGKAAKGLAYIEADYLGAKWHFRSSANRDAFLRSPDSYVPAFGGYCAGCISLSDPAQRVALLGSDAQPSAPDPTVFSIYKKRLYLFQNTLIKEQFDRDPETFIQAAEERWKQWIQLAGTSKP